MGIVYFQYGLGRSAGRVGTSQNQEDFLVIWWKTCGFLVKTCDFLVKTCDFLVKTCDFLVKTCDFISS